MVNRFYNPVIARFAALAALLALALVLAAPVAFAQVALTYPENGTEPVETFSATDQDGDAIVWSLDGPDKGDFDITPIGDGSSAELKFKKTPNYERSG